MIQEDFGRRCAAAAVLVMGFIATIASSTTGSNATAGGHIEGVPTSNPVDSNDVYTASARVLCANDMCERFVVEIANKTDQPLEIVWDKTQYVEAGQTRGGVVFEGIRFMEKDAPKPPGIVLPNGKLTKELVPSINIDFQGGRYGSGWHTTPMPRGDVGLFLTVKQGDREFSSIFAFTNKWVFPGESAEWKPPVAASQDAGVPAPATPDPPAVEVNDAGASSS